MEKWNLKKYKMVVNGLRVELQKTEWQDEGTALDIATDYLIEHRDLQRFINYNLGQIDAVRRLAEDIGYKRYNAKDDHR